MLCARSRKQTVVNWSNAEEASCTKRRDLCLSEIAVSVKRGAKTLFPEQRRGMFGEDEIHSDYQKEFKKKKIKNYLDYNT